MTRRRWLGLPLAGWALGACSSRRKSGATNHRQTFASTPAFWVWHRSSPLTAAENEDLRACHVRRLYWQAADCEWADQRWRAVEISRPIAAAGTDFAIVPVFRIAPKPAFLGNPTASADALGSRIKAWLGTAADLPEIQYDFDCPDRLLVEYARFLTRVGQVLPTTRITATALASWSGKPGFARVADAVAELVPMFYDLAADPPAEVRAGRFLALDADALRWIEAWRSCPTPWRAGLANFERVSIFAPDGKLVGHLRGWTHDAVFFHPSLAVAEVAADRAVFHVKQASELAGSRLEKDQRLVWRTVSPALRRQAVDLSERAGAGGVVYFALPGPGIQAAFSVRHLTAPAGTVPQLDVSISPEGVVLLRNLGPLDLSARPCDPQRLAEPGWVLELRAERLGAFRSTSPGEFMRVDTPDAVPAEGSRVVQLRFSRLPAGGAISSSKLVRSSEGVDWQIRGLPGTNH